MAVFKCKMCGGDLAIGPDQTVYECEYCGSRQTVPTADDEKKMNLFARAGKMLRGCEFDKASAIFESIVADFPTEAEAYWGLVLCKFGVEYVDDPATGKKIPTCHRSGFDSVMDDSDFELACDNADGAARRVYREEAKQIEELRKRIIEVSGKEEPYDVFICYKETAEDGERTPDSVMAQDICEKLTEAGYRVFFSRITLEDKLGQEYEPYIFAALNSAKIMLVFGTDYEYFNAVWVKNEWSRFLKLMEKDKTRRLIPCYKGIDAYDMPKEFKNLQAQDMGKIGADQDLIRGIKKLLPKEEAKPAQTVVQQVVQSGPGVESFIKRAKLFLMDGDWTSADQYADKALDIDPENAEGYLIKLLSERKLHSEEEIADSPEKMSIDQESLRFDNLGNDLNYRKFMLFAAPERKNKIGEYVSTAAKNEKYRDGRSGCIGIEDYFENDANRDSDSYCDLLEMNCKALDILRSIPGWKDADRLAAECEETIKKVKIQKDEAEKNEKYEIARSDFTGIEEWFEDENDRDYDSYSWLLKTNCNALKIFKSIPGWKDADRLAAECEETIKNIKLQMELEKKREEQEKEKRGQAKLLAKKYGNLICGGDIHSIGLRTDGVLFSTGNGMFGQCKVTNWRNVIAVSTNTFHTLGVCKDGTVVSTPITERPCIIGGETITKYDYGQNRVEGWTNIISAKAGFVHSVGLRTDGTVVAVGAKNAGQCNVEDWRDIIEIDTMNGHTVGLKSDGTVVAVGNNKDGQCKVDSWNSITSIAAGYFHTLGIRADGTVVACGGNKYGQCNVSNWNDIVAIACGKLHSVGLKSDGTVVAAGTNIDGQCEVIRWTDIVAIAAGNHHTLGLKSNGTVVAAGANIDGRINVSGWKLILTEADMRSELKEIEAKVASKRSELSGLKGIFANKRRKELEAEIAELNRKIDECERRLRD